MVLTIELSHLMTLHLMHRSANRLPVDPVSQQAAVVLRSLIHGNDVTKRVAVLTEILELEVILLWIVDGGLRICHTLKHFFMSDIFLGIGCIRIYPFALHW